MRTGEEVLDRCRIRLLRQFSAESGPAREFSVVGELVPREPEPAISARHHEKTALGGALTHPSQADVEQTRDLGGFQSIRVEAAVAQAIASIDSRMGEAAFTPSHSRSSASEESSTS